MSKKKDQLGKGIRALLKNIDEDNETAKIDESNSDSIINTVAKIPLSQIEVNPFQPRVDFNEEALQDLSNSIEVHGVIQPVTVRRMSVRKYQLIAGERRLRASKLAGLNDIPAYVRVINDQEALEIALIENIQREDLNAMEIAINYQRLIDECELTHESLGKRIGKNRSTVTNFLRLLKLPPDIQLGLKQAKLSMGHARALIGIEEAEKQLYVFDKILDQELSVRKTEELVRTINKGETTSNKATKSKPALSTALNNVQNQLVDRFQTKVRIKTTKGNKGEIVIPYYSNDDLNRLLDLMDND